MYFMMDEESDNYYNDQSPRYDLKKVLYFLSFHTKAKFVMESITPAVSDYCFALKGIYKIVDNSNVEKNPNVEVINMIDELKKGNNTYLSTKLKNALKTPLTNFPKNLSFIEAIVTASLTTAYSFCFK